MKCVICKKGETRVGKATVTLDKDGTTLVFKGVPARVCTNCGEEYVDEKRLQPAFSDRRPKPPAQEFRSKSVSTLRRNRKPFDVSRIPETWKFPL